MSMERLARFLVRRRTILLLTALLALPLLWPVALRLGFNESLEAFFPPEDPGIRQLLASREVFGGDEFVIVAWRADEPVITVDEERDFPVLTESASADIVRLKTELHAIEGINPQGTQDLHGLLENVPTGRNTRTALLRLFEGTLISRDHRTTAVILELLPESRSPVPRKETIDEVRWIARQRAVPTFVAGEPVQVHDMFRLVERDGAILFVVTLIVLSAVILFLFRRIRWVFVSIGAVLFAVVATRALLVVSGSQLSMVSSMLNSLVTVIAIATSMHLIVHYREMRRELSQEEAAVATIRDMAVPVFWTCLTTGIGFSALLVSSIIPVRSFSIMMTLGTGMVLVGICLLFPAALASGTKQMVEKDTASDGLLDLLLVRSRQLIERRPLLCGLWCAVLVLLPLPGLFQLQVETDFSRNFKDDSDIVRSLSFVEETLGGAGTWEISFDTPEEMSNEFLEQMRILTDEIQALNPDGEELPKLQVLSISDAVDIPPRIGSPTARLQRQTRRQPDLMARFYNEEKNRMRIVLRSVERQPSGQKLLQIEKVLDVAEEYLPPDSPPAATGLFISLATVILSLLSDQLQSFLVATAGIGIAMTLAFRSFRLGLISLVPNIFPIALVIGSLGSLDIPINIGTAMIASVSMGLTVDSTIHYITVFERSRATGGVSFALERAHASVGKAIVFAYIALILGFLVLTASQFIPLIYFGVLLSLSMATGLIGDLILLPLLLHWTSPKDAKTAPAAEPAAE